MLARRLRLREGVVRRGQDQLVHLRLDGEHLLLRRIALRHEPRGKGRDGIAHRVGLSLLGRAVHHLVVRQRVGVGPDHVRVHEGRALPLPRVLHGALHGAVAREEVAAIHLLHVESGEGAH